MQWLKQLIETYLTPQSEADKITPAELRTVLNQFAESLSHTAQFTDVITFKRLFLNLGTKNVNADLSFTIDSVEQQPGSNTFVRLVSDGVNMPNFTAFKQTSDSQDYVLNAGVVNLVWFFFDGTDYWYTIKVDKEYAFQSIPESWFQPAFDNPQEGQVIKRVNGVWTNAADEQGTGGGPVEAGPYPAWEEIQVITGITPAANIDIPLNAAQYANFEKIQIHVNKLVQINGNYTGLFVRTSTDGGSTYADAAGSYGWNLFRGWGQNDGNDSDVTVRIAEFGPGNIAGAYADIVFELTDITDETLTHEVDFKIKYRNAGGQSKPTFGMFYRNAQENINYLRIYTGGGTIDAQSIHIVGMKKYPDGGR